MFAARCFHMSIKYKKNIYLEIQFWGKQYGHEHNRLIIAVLYVCMMHAVLICLLNTQKQILNRYIMFGRGICGKYRSIDEHFSEPKGEWNLVSRLVFFANTPPNMTYRFNYNEYYLENCVNKYLLFVVFRNILFSLFISGTF